MNPDFTLELTGRLCLTLLHSLWQVAVLTFLVWCLERCVRSLTVERRYTLHAGALVLALALLPMTFLLTDAPIVPQTIEVSVANAPEQAAPIFEVPEADATMTAPVPTTITTPVVAPSAPPLPSPVIDAAVEPTPVEDAPPGWVTFAPWIAGAYAVGVLAMFARLLLSIGRAQRLKSRAVPVTTGPLVEKLCELSGRLSLRVRPMLAQAERVVVPQLVGLIRPTILLPTAAINGLSVDDLEMILLHELAHVRRHDLWINLLQRLAEVVLFFNPALWYLSRRISSLREYCCDELTCNTAADPDTTLRTRYATALVRVAELSQSSRRPATANELATLASTGRTPSELRRRIAHLLGEPLNEPLGLTRGTIIAAAVVLLGMTTFMLTSAETADDENLGTSEAETAEVRQPNQFSFGSTVEVVAIGTHDSAQRWWDVGGNPLDSVPFAWEHADRVSAEVDFYRRIVFRIENLPKDAEVKWDVSPTQATGVGTVTVDEVKPNEKYLTGYFSGKNDQNRVTLKVGVATGPWKKAAGLPANGTAALGLGPLSIVSSGAIESDAGTTIAVSFNDFDHDFRIVAIDKFGTLFDSIDGGAPSAGNVRQAKALFPALKPDDINRFEFQTRDYEWVEINDLPLHPKDDDNAANIPARMLQFPEDRAIGAVLTKSAAQSGFGFEDFPRDGWQEFSLARGVVNIPAGLHVRLNISRAASVDLTPLAELPPDAIESLSLANTDVTDDGLKHIAHLTGLRDLDLSSTRVTDAALIHLKDLHRLQTLHLYDAHGVHFEGGGVSDEGMKAIAQLPALKNITLMHTKLSDAGLAELAKCRTLRGLQLDGTAVTDEGLIPLLNLPHLNWLSIRFDLNGSRITNAGMETISQMSSLRYLDVSGAAITNEGLQRISGLTKLKRLSIDNTQVTGEGLESLASLQDLETLYYYERIDDESIKHVSKLKGLKNLYTHLEISDDGVAELAKLPLLEDLSLSGPTVTDAAIEHVVQMPSLKTLWFQHCPITDRGLSILRNNSNIEDLMIRGTEATTASLRSLMTLPNLKSLDLSLESTEETPQWEDLRWFNHLERLELSGSTFRSADLTHLQGLTQLSLLSLEMDQPIDDAGITSLAPLINLTGLGIYKSHVSDEGLKSLSNMTKLERLNVHCLATDEGLQALLPLKSLQSLEIASPYVTKDGVAAFTKQLPSLQTINHYRYRLDNSDISVSPNDRFFRRGWQAERGPQEALEGHAPPPLTVDRWQNIDGDSLSLDDLKGKVVLVYFWREPISWCRMQMPAVNALYEKYHDQGLEIIGVHSTEDADNLQFYADKHNIHWPVCADVDSQTNAAWHVQLNSGHYLLDRSGTLRSADLFQGHLEEAVKSLLAEAAPVDVSALEPPQIPLNIVIARHVMLLEGREIVTWDEVEKKIAELPDPSLAYPHLYETRGARESGRFEESEKTFWRIREKYKLKGHSVESLWPRTDWRYDQIESAEDLVPDESLRVEGSVVDAEGQPVADAEVILVTPVDESISYKSYHMALVEGRVRNPLEHVLTLSDAKGAFSIYPPPGTNYSIIALHPDHGFTLIQETSLVNDHRVTLLPWGGIVAELSEEPEQQVADLSTRISESDGRPEVVISQYWSDLKQEKPTLTFGFTHVPPIFDTTISRSFPTKDGGSTSVPGASVGLLPGETRRLDLGPLTKQQRERIEGTRKLMEQRQKQAEEPNDETSQISEPWKVRLKAIDQATGEVISRAKFEVEQLYEESEKNTRTDYSAEDDGAFVAEFETRTPDVCVLSCRAEGYTPVHGRWISPELSEEGEPLPEEVVFHMEKGVTVGGIVLNEDEEPVAGAKVLFSASNYDVAPGEKLVQTFSKDEFVTDEDGRWSCNYAPEQMTETLITVNHEDYAYDDSNWGNRPEFANLKTQDLVYYLRRRRTIQGQVTDPDGNPVEGAILTLGQYPDKDDPTFRTDADGRYAIEGLSHDRMAVIKPGFAPEEHIFADFKPNPFRREFDERSIPKGDLDFQLQLGITIEIHVTDNEGNPLKGAMVTPRTWMTDHKFRVSHLFSTWIGREFLPGTTNEQGLWRWTWAPHDDQLTFGVSHQGYTTASDFTVNAKNAGENITVKLESSQSQPHILVGLVVDAETKQSIKTFKVQRGDTSKNRLARPLEPERYGKGWVDWRPTSYIPGKDGRFLTNITVPFGKGKYVYRVLADGYETAIGEPVMNDDGDPVLIFELERRP